MPVAVRGWHFGPVVTRAIGGACGGGGGLCRLRRLNDPAPPAKKPLASNPPEKPSMAPRVLVSPIEMVEKPARWHEILTEAGFEIVCRPPEVSLRDPDKLLEWLPGIDALVAGLETVNRKVLEKSGLRAVARYGVGYDSVDVEAATERGIAVTITPGVNHISVAEHTLAMIFGLLRLVPERDAAVRDGSWRRYPMPRLAGKTLGLVGLGRIGKALATRAQGIGREGDRLRSLSRSRVCRGQQRAAVHAGGDLGRVGHRQPAHAWRAGHETADQSRNAGQDAAGLAADQHCPGRAGRRRSLGRRSGRWPSGRRGARLFCRRAACRRRAG